MTTNLEAYTKSIPSLVALNAVAGGLNSGLDLYEPFSLLLVGAPGVALGLSAFRAVYEKGHERVKEYVSSIQEIVMAPVKGMATVSAGAAFTGGMLMHGMGYSLVSLLQ